MLIERDELLSAFAFAARFVEKNDCTLPVLQNLSLTAKDGFLNVIGADLEQFGGVRLEIDPSEKWAITVPAKACVAYLSATSTDYVEIGRVGESEFAIKHTDGAALFDGMTVDHFPSIPVTAESFVTLPDIGLAARRVVKFLSTEEGRFTLDGAMLEIKEGSGALIATDGHRLSFAPLKVPEGSLELWAQTIVARETLQAISCDPGCWRFALDGEFQFFASGNKSIISRKLSGRFPDYNRDFPNKERRGVVVNSGDLKRAVLRVSTCSDQMSKDMLLEISNGLLSLRTSNCLGYSATASLAIENADCDRGTKLNWEYVLGVLADAPETITVLLEADSRSPVEFATACGWRALVMPMRILQRKETVTQ